MEKQFLGLAHIAIFTDNIDKSVNFYTENLGFKKMYETYLVKDDGNLKYIVVELNNCAIELLETDENKNALCGIKGTIAHIALEVRNIEGIVKDLKNKKIEFTQEIRTFDTLFNGVYSAFIKGPSGELIELFEYK